MSGPPPIHDLEHAACSPAPGSCARPALVTALDDVDKAQLVAELVDALGRARDTVAAAQRGTQEGVTHADARSEGDKDMRATEASYVARGQAMRVEALDADVAKVTSMKLRRFGPDDPAALSALVVLDQDGAQRVILLAPAGGGVRLCSQGREIDVVTPASPLGRALLGARVGDAVSYQRGGTEDEVELVAIR